MTVQEMIDKLNKVEDKSKVLIVEDLEYGNWEVKSVEEVAEFIFLG